MSCDHCRHAVSAKLVAVPGVESVDVNLETKLAAVSGERLDDAALRAAIVGAGYEPA
jgi:copper chaperone CopZ